jgi:hypothetical protein
MRAGNGAGLPIHRSAKTDAGCPESYSCEQLRERLLDLAADAFSAVGGVDCQFSSIAYLASLIARYELELGAADFDSKIMLHQGSPGICDELDSYQHKEAEKSPKCKARIEAMRLLVNMSKTTGMRRTRTLRDIEAQSTNAKCLEVRGISVLSAYSTLRSASVWMANILCLSP